MHDTCEDHVMHIMQIIHTHFLKYQHFEHQLLTLHMDSTKYIEWKTTKTRIFTRDTWEMIIQPIGVRSLVHSLQHVMPAEVISQGSRVQRAVPRWLAMGFNIALEAQKDAHIVIRNNFLKRHS